MSLEDKIDRLTTAVDKLNENIAKNGGVAGAKAGTGTGAKAATTVKKSKFTPDQVKAAILEVREKISRDAAAELIEEVAGAGSKLADLINKPDVFDKAMEACAAAIEGAGGDEGGDDEGL